MNPTYKVTQNGDDLFHPTGASLSDCITAIAEYIGYYMGVPPKQVTIPEAIDQGFRVERVA